jgi:hypothetical protein
VMQKLRDIVSHNEYELRSLEQFRWIHLRI